MILWEPFVGFGLSIVDKQSYLMQCCEFSIMDHLSEEQKTLNFLLPRGSSFIPSNWKNIFHKPKCNLN